MINKTIFAARTCRVTLRSLVTQQLSATDIDLRGNYNPRALTSNHRSVSRKSLLVICSARFLGYRILNIIGDPIDRSINNRWELIGGRLACHD